MGPHSYIDRVAPQTPPDDDAAAARLANRQQGNASHSQLRALGYDDDAIAWRVKRGRFFRVHHGVYAIGRPPHTPIQHASAAVLACGPGAALSHHGALALWGFAKEWPRRFEVVLPPGADYRPQGIVTHRYRGLIRDDITTHHGIRVTSPARTILDTIRRYDDRARKRLVNDALHSLYLREAELADVRRRFPRHPAAKLLDPFLSDTQPGITRSPLEDDFLAFCARHDLPTPQTNIRIDTNTVDALFPDHNLIVELDSWEYHRTRQDFENDRERDAAHLSQGIRTLRITWDRLHARPAAEADRLRKILRLARP